jgi:hypothetical protein
VGVAGSQIFKTGFNATAVAVAGTGAGISAAGCKAHPGDKKVANTMMSTKRVIFFDIMGNPLGTGIKYSIGR